MAAVGRPRIAGIRPITIRLRERDVAVARREGKRRALPYQAVVREWVAKAAESVR